MKPRAHDDTRTPAWGHDLGRNVILSVMVTVLAAFIVFATSSGLMKDKQWEEITEVGLFAAIMTAVFGWMFPFLMAEHKREDSGFRSEGLFPLLLVSALLGTVILTASSVLWPWIGTLHPETGQLAELVGRHPVGLFYTAAMYFTAAMISCAFFVLMATAPFAVMVPASAPWLGMVLTLLGYFGLSGGYIGVAIWLGLREPSAGGLLFLAVCVPVSVLLCAAGIGLVQRLRRRLPDTVVRW